MTDAIVARWENLTEAGRRFLSAGDEARAEESFRAAVSLAEGHTSGQPLQAAALDAIAQLKLRQQAHSEAEALFRSALALRERAFGPDHPVVAITLNGLAAAYAARGALAEAEGVLRRALSALNDDPSAQRELSVTLSALARLYFRQGDYERAEPLLLQLLSVKQQELGREHPEVAAVLMSLAALRGAIGRHDHAEQLLRKALAIREATGSPSGAAVATLRGKLADAVAAQGRHEEAAALRSPGSAPNPAPVVRPAAHTGSPVAAPPVTDRREAPPPWSEPPAAPVQRGPVATRDAARAVPVEKQIAAPAPAPVSDSPALPIESAITTVQGRPSEPAPSTEATGGAATGGPNGATLFAAAAALALDELESTPKPARPPRAPAFDPNAPLWPRTDRVVQGSSSRPAPEPLAPAPFAPAPLAPVVRTAPNTLGAPLAPPAGPAPAAVAPTSDAAAPAARPAERAVPPVAASRPRAPRRLPKVSKISISISIPPIHLTAGQKRTAWRVAAAIVGISIVGEIAAILQAPSKPEPAPQTPPAAVAEAPERPVDEDDPSRLPSLTGDAIGWVQPATGDAGRSSPARVRNGEVARVGLTSMSPEMVPSLGVSEESDSTERDSGPSLPRAPSVRVDLRSVDERVRAGVRGVSEEALAKMPAIPAPGAPRLPR